MWCFSSCYRLFWRLFCWEWIRKATAPASHISVLEAWNIDIYRCWTRSFQILASVLLFPKASESDRRTEGYRLVLVIAQRVWVINNKGGKGEGHSNLTWGPEQNNKKTRNLIFRKYQVTLYSVKCRILPQYTMNAFKRDVSPYPAKKYKWKKPSYLFSSTHHVNNSHTWWVAVLLEIK